MAEDMMKLQQDAIRRAREIYSRSGSRPAPSAPPPSHREAPAVPDPKDIFTALFQDKDKTLILSLLLLLSEEKCSSELIFALIYLLM